LLCKGFFAVYAVISTDYEKTVEFVFHSGYDIADKKELSE